ncbi:MAG: transporter substrate-binding domain-containing protein, partial [Calditrichaeota bacterium]|nr:transporter substrate-binding domain-containing protein [Calditrichota bacterium]
AKFELEFIRNILQILEKDSKQKINIKYTGVKDFKSSFISLEAGEKDQTLLINNVSITESRKKVYDFSEPYIFNKYALMSKKNYFFKDDETKKRVGVRIGGFAETLSKNLHEEFPVEVKGYKSLPLAQKALGKEIDMILSDYIMVWAFNLKLIKIYKPDLSNDFAIMYKKGSVLKDQIDAAMQKFKKTDQFKKLIKKHFANFENLFFES